MPQKAKKSGNLRQTILKNSFDLFKENGYNKTGINNIAEKTCLTPAQIRHIFPTKKEIFMALFNDERRKTRKKLESHFTGVNTGDRNEVAVILKKLFLYVYKSSFLKMISQYEDFPVWYCINSDDESHIPITDDSSLFENFLDECQQADTLRSWNIQTITQTCRTFLILILNDRGILRKSRKIFDLFVEIIIDGMLYKT